MIDLLVTKRTDPRLLARMAVHYSAPRGFVGRNICYAVMVKGDYFGHIVAGSATKFLPLRHEFLHTHQGMLNNIVNNIFFNVSPVHEKYPFRNFTSQVVNCFVEYVKTDWQAKYGNPVVGIETLVEKPRTGELYKRAGFCLIGETKGYTCKRVSGKGTDSWSGKRVWDTTNLRPKLVFCKRIN